MPSIKKQRAAAQAICEVLAAALDPSDEGLVEATAKAIRDAFPHIRVGSRPLQTWEELYEDDREAWRRMARAALRALGAHLGIGEQLG